MYSCRGSIGPRVKGNVALDLPSLLKLDIFILVERPNGSSWITGCGGFTIAFGGRGRIHTCCSSRSSPECTPLDVSDGARSGGEVELSVDVVSERGVNSASVGTPESALRRHLGVNVVGIYKYKIMLQTYT